MSLNHWSVLRGIPRPDGIFQPGKGFEEVSQWWRGQESPICFVIGEAGTGKSSLLRRFADAVNDNRWPNSDPGDLSCSVAEYTLEFGADVNTCLRDLWEQRNGLRLDVNDAASLCEEIIRCLRQFKGQENVLIIIDGIEFPGRGMSITEICKNPVHLIEDDMLRKVLLLAHDGVFPRVRWLVGCRTDAVIDEPKSAILENDWQRIHRDIVGTLNTPRENRSRMTVVHVGSFDDVTCAAIAADHGLRGNVVRLATWCGRHPLTFARACGSIRQWFDSNIDAADLDALFDDDDEDAVMSGFTDHERYLAQKQAAIAQFDLQRLGSESPAAVALIKRMSLFHLPVPVQLHDGVLTTHDGVRLDNPELESMASSDQRQLTERLEHLHILVRHADNRFHIHPLDRRAIRSIVPREERQATHGKLAGHLSLYENHWTDECKSPDFISIRTFDDIEEYCFQLCQAGKAMTAWRFLQSVLPLETLYHPRRAVRGIRILNLFSPNRKPFKKLSVEMNREVDGLTLWIHLYVLHSVLGNNHGALQAVSSGAQATKNNDVRMIFQGFKAHLLVQIGFMRLALEELNRMDRQPKDVSLEVSNMAAINTSELSLAASEAGRIDVADGLIKTIPYASFRHLIQTGRMDRKKAQCLLAESIKPKNVNQSMSATLGIVHLALHCNEFEIAEEYLQKFEKDENDITASHPLNAIRRNLVRAELCLQKMSIGEPLKSDVDAFLQSIQITLEGSISGGLATPMLEAMLLVASFYVRNGNPHTALRLTRCGIYGTNTCKSIRSIADLLELDPRTESDSEMGRVIQPDEKGNMPLVALGHRENRHPWKLATAEIIMARSMLLMAEKKHGSGSCHLDTPLVDEACNHLEECKRVLKPIQDQVKFGRLPLIKEAEELLGAIYRGKSNEYPPSDYSIDAELTFSIVDDSQNQLGSTGESNADVPGESVVGHSLPAEGHSASEQRIRSKQDDILLERMRLELGNWPNTADRFAELLRDSANMLLLTGARIVNGPSNQAAYRTMWIVRELCRIQGNPISTLSVTKGREFVFNFFRQHKILFFYEETTRASCPPDFSAFNKQIQRANTLMPKEPDWQL